jgi:oligoendopeptidase F
MRKSEGKGMLEISKSIYTKFSDTISFMEPEFLKLGIAKLNRYKKSKSLKDYDRYFTSLIKSKKHILSTNEESLLSKSGIMSMVSYSAYSTFTNSDMEFPGFVDKDGNRVKLSSSMYSKYRTSLNRDERKKVFGKFWSTYKKYRNTFAQTLSGQVKYISYIAKARKYKNSLDSALTPKNIPVKYYKNLIKSINNNLGAFHDYLKLRKNLLNIQGDQEYYDIYPPLVLTKPSEYNFKLGKEVVRTALKPLGKEYLKHIDEAFKDNSGWIDVFPNKGKRSGAYMDSLYGKNLHPYVLLNYTKDFNSVSTLAHEMGHAIHSVYSNAAQPYPKADYSTFNAEVASIVNEALLIEHLLKTVKDKKIRRFLLSYYLDSFRGTVFRQTMFAEFEMKVYENYEAGKPITADLLDGLYLDLLKKYHGHDKNVMKINKLYAAEWSYIPHFYYHFYVYTYVNGFIAATVLADKIIKEGKPAADKYINGLLKAGSSKDPLTILKDAGIDMLKPETFKKAIAKFKARTKELEQLAATK